MSDQSVVVVVAGGGPPGLAAVKGLPADAHVIAADAGLEHARALGLRVDLVVGDMDSVSPAVLDEAAASGSEVERHPEAKDETDLELALDHAMELQPSRIVVVGSDAGRLDHLLAGVLLLASDRYAGATIEARLGPARLTIVRDEAELHGSEGELVTLLPLGGPVSGVTTEGLLYPLQGETLAAGSPRGVSNVFTTPTARVRLAAGVLLAVQPGNN